MIWKKITTFCRLIQKKDFEIIQIFILRKISSFVLPKYRFKWPQIDWWSNAFFNNYLEKFDEIRGFNTDRRWMLSQLIRLTAKISGDTVECGVYRGASSYIICKMNEKSPFPKNHHVFDSFEGVSSPGDFDGRHWEKGALSCAEYNVRENLSEFSHVTFYKGWIPDRFSEVADKQFSFVHIDVDLFQPTKDSLEFFYPRIEKGGIIVCDDYGSSLCPGATKACDEFLADKPEKMLTMSGCGGFLIKGVETSSDWGKD